MPQAPKFATFRFTPTRVGTTRNGVCPIVAKTVHPHACGDHVSPSTFRSTVAGSPPRVWGPPGLRSCSLPPSRFTPTRVGTTAAAPSRPARSAVHPHACGDHRAMPEICSTHRGSPPRVWGPRHGRLGVDRRRRFTPTRVGTTIFISACIRVSPVHPHACGDHAAGLPERTPVYGSPPRVWGPRKRIPDPASCDRFTPTRVGTTSR